MKLVGRITLLASLVLTIPAVADQEEDPYALDPLVVTATRRPLRLSEFAGHISLITARELEQQLTENDAQMFRYEPGIDTDVVSTRFGADSFTIRGIGGNRVAIEIDGVPLRNGFGIGSYASAGRALVDPDRIKRVEVLHGPASVMFGSDALGGVLAFTTWAPDDLVARGNGSGYLNARAGYQSETHGQVAAVQAAWAAGGKGLLLAGALREGKARDSAAVPSDELDPQEWQQHDFAVKYTFDARSGNRLTLSASHFERETRTDVQSLLGYGRFVRTLGLLGDDRDVTTRLLVDYAFESGWLESGVVRIYLDDSDTRQHTDEARRAPPYASETSRDFSFQNRTWGAEWSGFHAWESGASDHLLGLGVEYLGTRLEEQRDGLERNLASGEVTKEILGETLPTRDFPISTTEQWGVFAEDRIRLDGGRWEITPALRFESYQLNAESDALYEAAFQDAALVSLSETRLTPRVAVGRVISDQWRVYLQYAQGFRAPPAEDVNIGFDLPRFRYRAIPNPDLESEVSRGYELGLRHVGSTLSLSMTWFDTRFENLIESRAPKGIDPATGYLEFQSRNIGRARIYGLDFRLNQALSAWNETLERWHLSAALSWTRGDNDSNGQALNSVSPPQAILGLEWRSFDSRFDAAVHGTFTARQSRIDESEDERFVPSSWQVYDITAGWRFRNCCTIRVGVFNVTDETYWRWGDVRSLTPGDPMIPLLAQAGRNIQLSVSFETGAGKN